MLWEYQDAWVQLLEECLACRPMSESNPEGVSTLATLLAGKMEHIGFAVNCIVNSKREGSMVLVAIRQPRESTNWIGMCGHWDVEIFSQDEWSIGTNALQPTIHNERVYCRGVGDNLGPLLHRLLVLSMPLTPCPGIVWVLHGEEETGSFFPQEIYPTLAIEYPILNKVSMWLEETGYFLSNRDQRLLVHHRASDEALLHKIISALEVCAQKDGNRKVLVKERYMNKKLGGKNCPNLRYLIRGNVPYLAIGINDVATNIHRSDESIPLDTLAVAATQFTAVLTIVAKNS